MRIRHLEQIFVVDKVVPVDVLLIFRQILLHCYLSRCVFYGSHNFPGRSLLLSTTVLNDIEIYFIYRQVMLLECFLCGEGIKREDLTKIKENVFRRGKLANKCYHSVLR